MNIFYSWQSDTDSKENRNFIEDAIKRALKKLSGVEEITVERDTKGDIGSPNIEEAIFGTADRLH